MIDIMDSMNEPCVSHHRKGRRDSLALNSELMFTTLGSRQVDISPGEQGMQ